VVELPRRTGRAAEHLAHGFFHETACAVQQQGALNTGQVCLMPGQKENRNLEVKNRKRPTWAHLFACLARHGGRPLQRKQSLGCKICSCQSVQAGVVFAGVKSSTETLKRLACRASAVETGVRSHPSRCASPQRRTPVARELIANATAAK
jgi:hypothetical protein